MWRDAALVGGKDLRVEWHSRVAAMQVAPYAVVVLLLFGFAFDQDHALLTQAAPGLFWVAVLLSSLLAVQRSYAIESSDGARDGLRLTGLDPAGIFLGKAAAVAAQLLLLEVLLGFGVVVLFGTRLHDPALLVVSALAATVGLAAAGTVYGMVASGLRVRETLLPMLILPVVAPVLLGATQCWMAALGSARTDGWKWLSLLAAFGAIYTALGVVSFSTLVEET
ncbi:MAG TPA: heme exporter protein CcmB [Acidimicrobiales bacterium]|nr:heme exporter protein CcmB [Acidimicrobiales bacterium]